MIFGARWHWFVLFLVNISVANAALDFYPRATSSLLYSDNLNRATESDSRLSDFVAQIRPGFSVVQATSRWTSNVSADMQYLKYARESEADDIFFQFGADTTGELIAERLFLNAYSVFGQGNVDARDSSVVSNETLTSGRTDIFTVRVAPTWIQPLGRAAVSEATAGYGIVRYPGNVNENVPLDPNALIDSDLINMSWLLRSPAEVEQYFWTLGYYEDQVRYDNDQEDRLQRVTLDVGYALSPRLRLVGLVGREDNRFERNATETIAGLAWNAGFRWRPSARNDMEFRFGKREEIGDTYQFDWTYTGQRLSVNAGYQEDYSAIAQRINELADPMTVVPGFQDDLPSIRRDAFLRKYLGFDATYATPKTSVGFGAFNEHRLFRLGNRDREKITGFNLGLNRRLSAASHFEAHATWRDQSLVGGTNVVIGFLVAYNRRIGRSWYLRPSYSRRSADGTGSESQKIVENRVMIELIWDTNRDTDSVIFNSQSR